MAQSLEQAARKLEGGDVEGAKQSLAKAAAQMNMMQQLANSGPVARKARQFVAQAKQSLGQGGSRGQKCAKCSMPLDEFGNCPACSGAYGSANQGQGQAGGQGQGQGQGASMGSGMAGGQGQFDNGTGQNASGQGQGLAALGGQQLTGRACGRCGGRAGQCKCAGSGGAFGGPGRGRGGVAPRGSGDGVRWSDVKVKGRVHPGEVLASVKVKGVPKTGEASVKYAEVYAAYKRQAEESLGKDPVPLGYREYVKDYFDEIEPVKK